MIKPTDVIQASSITVQCPYCSKDKSIDTLKDYSPAYTYCDICNKKFVVEKLAEGIQVFTIAEAPYSSDPDCIEIEMGSSDEQ